MPDPTAGHLPEPLAAEPGTDLADAGLRRLWHELRANGEEARRLTTGLDARAFWWRPAPGRWSVAECLAHVVLAGRAYHEEIDPVIRGARARGETDGEPTRGTRLGRLLVRSVEPPARLRLPAPRSIRPARPEQPGDDPAAAPTAAGSPLGDFLQLRHEHARRLRHADGLATARIRVASPFVPLVMMNLDTALRLITAHERRHLWQAQQVLAHREFPRPARAAAAG
jgi:hypothetical protein